MYQTKVNVPNGYVVMSDTFEEFLDENNIKYKIKNILVTCDI